MAWQTGKLDQRAGCLLPSTSRGFIQGRSLSVCLCTGACIYKLAEIVTEVKIPSSKGQTPCDSTGLGDLEEERDSWALCTPVPGEIRFFPSHPSTKSTLTPEVHATICYSACACTNTSLLSQCTPSWGYELLFQKYQNNSVSYLLPQTKMLPNVHIHFWKWWQAPKLLLPLFLQVYYSHKHMVFHKVEEMSSLSEA